MKFSDPRCTLIAGLSLALGLNAVAPSRAAEPRKLTFRMANPSASQSLAQVPPPAPMPDLSDAPSTPGASTPQPGALTPIPQPQVQSAPTGPVTIAPPVIPPPNTAPVQRAPLGLHYGEQEQLDQLQTETLAPRPLPLSTGTPVPPQLPATPNEGNVDRFGYAPPPGTLGQTYRRKTRLIDDKKHPRVGMVDVYLPEEVDVTSPGMKVKWTGKVWRLESDPLLPGVPHIYEIKAQWGEGTEPQYRTVRLIMGRIVDLEF